MSELEAAISGRKNKAGLMIPIHRPAFLSKIATKAARDMPLTRKVDYEMSEKRLGIVIAGAIGAFLTWIVGTGANSDAVVKVSFILWGSAVLFWVICGAWALIQSKNHS